MMSPSQLLLCLVPAVLLSSPPVGAKPQISALARQATQGVSEATMLYTDNLDSPKVNPINATTWDWWYFDVTADVPENETDTAPSVVLMFSSNGPRSFPVPFPDDILRAAVTILWPDGTATVTTLFSENAVVKTSREASFASWDDGTNSAVWHSDPAAMWGAIHIDAPELGLTGSIQWDQIAPPHLPCGPAAPNGSYELVPHLGWVNPVPDSLAVVDFTVSGTRLNFKGSGYHDKNWSDIPFQNSTSTWYWGHGRVGKYSIVWFDILDKEGVEYAGAYAAVNGSIVTASCGTEALRVRPWGGDDAYPPSPTSGDPAGFAITMRVPEGILDLNVTTKRTVLDVPRLYTRWTGPLVGKLRGCEETLTGIALYEQIVS